MLRRCFGYSDELPLQHAAVQGNMEFNAMDVMFGQDLPHMGLMGRATSGQYIDPGLDYASLGYPQMQVNHHLLLGSRSVFRAA